MKGFLGFLMFLGFLATPAFAQTDPYEAAVNLARQGRYEESLDSFQKLVAAEPRHYDARLWIARLHGWMGHAKEAESVYRAVLAERVSNVEAMTGLAGLLTNAGRLDEALALLGEAENTAPASADVLAGIARTSYFAGETTRAAQYIERAAATSPTPELRILREQIRRAHDHRIEVTGFGEHFTADIPAAGNVDAAVSLRVHERLRVSARGQFQDKFDVQESRAGGGIEWRINRVLRLAGSVLAASDTVILPTLDASVEVGLVRGLSDWSASFRRIHFESAEVSVFSPGAAWSLNDRVTFSGRYALAITAFETAGRQITHSGGAGVSMLTGTRVWWSAGYNRGIERFETLSPDRIGEFRADTVSGGVRVELPSLSTLAAVYERQWRTRGTTMGRLLMVFAQRF